MKNQLYLTYLIIAIIVANISVNAESQDKVNTLLSLYPVVSGVAETEGISTSYNASNVCPATRFKYRDEKISGDEGKKVILVDKVMKSIKKNRPDLYIKGINGDDGFISLSQYHPDAPYWAGSCHRWCDWNSNVELVKRVKSARGFSCGKDFFTQEEVSEFLTAIYQVDRLKNQNSENKSFWYGIRTNPFITHETNILEMKEDLILYNNLLLRILSSAGYNNLWAHKADHAWDESIIKNKKICITQKNSHSFDIWNQPTYSFSRDYVSDFRKVKSKKLPLIKIFYNKFLGSDKVSPHSFAVKENSIYFGPTFFYTGDKKTINTLKQIEGLDNMLINLFYIGMNKKVLERDLEINDYFSELSVSDISIIKLFKLENEKIEDLPLKVNKLQKHIFRSIREKITLKNEYEGVVVKSTINFRQESEFLGKYNPQREKKYKYYIFKNKQNNKIYSMWAKDKMIPEARPDYIYRKSLIADYEKKLALKPNAIKNINEMPQNIRLSKEDLVYQVLTGVFLNFLDSCSLVL